MQLNSLCGCCLAVLIVSGLLDVDYFLASWCNFGYRTDSAAAAGGRAGIMFGVGRSLGTLRRLWLA